MRPRIDPVFLALYREHAATYANPPCGCALDAPDRECDVGYSLWVVATRNRDIVNQGCIVGLMR